MISVTSPTLIVDKATCEENIARMAGRARRFGIRLKPHMKTHQSADIGGWMREAGIRAITVSSVEMAEYFAEAGWTDITIAFPVNVREMDRISKLAGKIGLSILLSDEAVLPALEQRLKNRLSTYIEIDSGSRRTGLPWDNAGQVEKLLSRIVNSTMLRLAGLYTHPGHSYAARSDSEIDEINRKVHERLTGLREELGLNEEELPVCVGDTPCCSKGTHFSKIKEWSPGNFVFYDLMQGQIGACRTDDVAVALACPVVARHPGRGEVTVHGGAVHLSKESLREDGSSHYGRIVRFTTSGWSEPLEGCRVDRLSQEHGTISLAPDHYETFSPGDLVGILPVHSCLTADLMGGYRTLSGESLGHLRNP